MGGVQPSFISNVNKIADYLDFISELNQYLSKGDIEILLELSKVRLNSLKDDIDKGTFYGQRKIEFDILKNYIDYSEDMTDEEAKALYQDPNNQVRYKGITLYTINNESKYYDFIHLEVPAPITIATPIELYHQLEKIINEDTFMVSTNVNYIVDEITNHTTILSSALVNGSNLQKAVLHADTSLVNYKEADRTYAWVDYTSSLVVLSDHLDALITLYNNLDSLLSSETTIGKAAEILADIDAKLTEIQELALEVEGSVSLANETLAKFATVSVGEVITGLPQEPAAVSYDVDTNSFSFTLPKGDRGDPVTPDETDIFANRPLYDTSPRGFLFFASDQGLLYAKNSDTSGDWGVAIEFGKGDKGDKGDPGPQGPPGSAGDISYASTDKEGLVKFGTNTEATTGLGTDLDKKPITITQYHYNAQKTLDSAKAYVGVLSGYTLNITRVADRDTLTFVKR